MSAADSIIGQCPDCCTCPTATVEWDSRSASKTANLSNLFEDNGNYYTQKTVVRDFACDYYTEGGTATNDCSGPLTSTTITITGSYTNVYTRNLLTGIETETGWIGSVDITQVGTFSGGSCGPSDCTPGLTITTVQHYESDGVTCENTSVRDDVYAACLGLPSVHSDFSGSECYRGVSASGSGIECDSGYEETTTFAGEKSPTNAIEESLSAAIAAIPAYDDDWNDTAGSFLNIETSGTATTTTIRESRYRLRFKIPQVNTGKNLRASWVERFIAEAGVAVSSVEVYARGVYRPTVTLSASPLGTNAAATAVMASDGTVASLSILNPGAGYIPLITFSGGGGTGAAAIAIINSSGAVTGVTITSGGSGYTSAPTVAFTNVTAPRVRATGTATVSGGVVTGINIGTAGDFRPTVTVQAATGGGTSSTGWIATLTTTGQVASIASGSAGNYLPTLVFSAPGGSPAGVTATATCTVDSQGGIATVTMGTAGTKYLTEPTLTITPKVSASTAADLLIHLGTETAKCAVWDGTTLGGKWVKREVVDAGHPLSTIEVVHGGNYLPVVTIQGGGGTGATATVTGFSADGKVTAISVGEGGTGYTSAPSVTITGRNGGSGATATATVSGGAVTGITVVNQGNYLPTLSITSPSAIQVTLSAPPAGGTQATARANVSSNGLVTSITVTSQGSGYTSAPTVTVLAAGTGGTQATGWTANLTTERVTSITGGTSGDYAVAGTVTLTSAGAISAVTLTKTGAGFKTNPTIALSYGTETILLAAHFGTETEYADNAQPAGTTPLGYVDGVVSTYPLIGNAGTAPWKYYELAVPATDGTTTVANLRTVCDGTACP